MGQALFHGQNIHQRATWTQIPALFDSATSKETLGGRLPPLGTEKVTLNPSVEGEGVGFPGRGDRQCSDPCAREGGEAREAQRTSRGCVREGLWSKCCTPSKSLS